MRGKSKSLSAIVVVALAALLSACNNPFQVGFGDNVDIDRPNVSLEAPGLGSFLRGTVEIQGVATDDVAVATVSISFDRGATWLPVTSLDASTGRWTYQLDTLTRPNGTLSVMVRVTDNTGKQTTTEELLFTIDNEAPTIIFTFPSINPDTYDPLNPPTIGKNGAVFGTVTDRDSIALDYPQIRFWRVIDSEPASWTSMRTGDTSLPSVFDFKYNIPTEQVGEHFVRVTVADVGGQVRTMPPEGQDGYRVVVVSGAPQVAITAPQQASYARGTTVVTGTMSHETGNQPDLTLRFSERNNPVPLLEAQPGDPGFDVTPDGSDGYEWSYELDTTALPDDTIIAQAFAEIGSTTGFDNLVFQVDNEVPMVTVTGPGYLDTVYSTVTLRGTASDNTGVDEVAIRIGADTDFLALAGTYNWLHPFDSNTYGNTTHAVEWDPVADEPYTGPPEDRTEIWRLPIAIRVTDPAGNVRVVLHELYIYQDLDKPTVTVLSPTAGSNLAGPVLVTGTAFDADPGIARVELQIIAITDTDEVIGNLTPAGDALAVDAWHEVTGTTQWSREINSNGKLYSVTSTDGAYHPNALTHNGRLRLRVRAVDAGGKLGNVQELAIRLDETIPAITSIEPASGSYVSGLVTLTATITDDEEIVSVAISYDGGSTYPDVVYSGPGLGLKTYNLSHPVNTLTLPPVSASSVRNLGIRVRDNANYTTISTVVLNVDNYWPDGELVTTTWNPMAMEGLTFELRGIAWDRDRGVADNQYPVRGIDTVDVYIEDRRPGSPTLGQFYHLSGGATVVAALQDLGNSQGNKPVVTSSDHRIRIDRTHIGSIDFKAIEVDGSDSTWWTRVDSTQLPDGHMEVHYLFTDRAGNRTHRSDAGFVRNNPPVIDLVTVGTDLNYDTEVDAGERFTYAGQFNARGIIYIMPTVSGGNGTPTYDVFNSTDMDTPLVLTDDTLDISNTLIWPDGNYTLVVRVTDEVGIEVDQNLLVTVDQADTTAPTLAINAVPVAGDGHVEPVSPLNVGRPSLSGTVTMSGTAWDNQRIREIRITAPGIGTNVLAAEWEAGTTHDLVSRLTGFTVVSSDIDEATGHHVSWSYTWNTATLPGRAALGVVFDMSVQDFRTGTPPAITANRTYDVVPYITQVSTDTSGVRDRNIRSANGRYTIARSDSAADTIVISGYNLDPIANGVRVSASTTGLSGTTLEGDALTVVAVAGDNTSVTVRKNATASGYLAVIGGTAPAPIPTINNIVDNPEPSTDQRNPTLTDDRYLTFFNMVETGFVNGYYPEMLMDDDYPVFGFIDDSAASDLQFARGTVTGETGSTALTSRVGLIRGLGFQYYALARDDDGVYHQLASSTFNSENQYYIYGEYASDYNGACGYGTDNCGATRVYWFGYTGNRAESDNNDAIILDSLSYDPGLLVGRYNNPRMIATGSSTDALTAASVYMVYYDEAIDEILFRSFQAGQAPAGGTSRSFNGSGGVNIGENPTATSGDGTRHTVADTASQYFDFGVTDGGVVVVVYFNQSSGRLNLRYSVTTDGGTTAQTIDGSSPTAAVFFSDPIEVPRSFTGSYVSLAIETDGNPATPDPIHIAAHDSGTAALAYVRFDSFADTSPSVVLVDSNLSVGIWTDISVNAAGVPYIGYYNSSETGTRDSVKLAYFNGDTATAVTPGVDALGNVTGNWEFMTVPALDAPNGGIAQFARVNVGFDTAGNPVVGYLADDLEYGRLLPDW